MIRSAYDRPLAFEPGTRWEYSNLGYFGLAEVIRVASGRPWTEFFDERIFGPLGMASTWPTNTDEAATDRATDDRLLADSTHRAIWTPVTLEDGSTYPFGLGWQLDEVNGHRVAYHTGGMTGFRAGFARFVDDGLSVIVLMNLDDVDVHTILFGVARLYLSEPAPSGIGARASLTASASAGPNGGR